MWFLSVWEEQLPELSIFLALADGPNFFARFLIILEKFNMLVGLIEVRLNITLRHLSTLPDVKWYVCSSLNNKHSPWI